MPLFDATPQRGRLTSAQHDQEPAVPIDLVDELRQPHVSANLARGIVWADILADIAADEEARQRGAETPWLRDAA
jgi:hypothetical protein